MAPLKQGRHFAFKQKLNLRSAIKGAPPPPFVYFVVNIQLHDNRGGIVKLLIAPLMCMFAIGCSVPRSVPEGGTLSGARVDPASKVLILSIADGQEKGDAPANGSGRGMVSVLRKTLSEHGVNISTSEASTAQQGFDEASKMGFDCVLKCVIVLWEDNATAWSGNGDKLKISVEIFDVKTHQLLAASSHYRVATGATFVSGTPDRFMDECARGALGKIYGWPQ